MTDIKAIEKHVVTWERRRRTYWISQGVIADVNILLQDIRRLLAEVTRLSTPCSRDGVLFCAACGTALREAEKEETE